MGKLKKALIVGVAVPVIWAGTWLGLSFCSNIINDPIKSEEHLIEIVETEKKKLGLENKDIEVDYSPNWKNYTTKDGSKYKVTIDRIGADEGDVKHELYHVKKGHVEKVMGMSALEANIKYCLVYEPQAIMYELTGLEF
ncbi:MAG: hypothetical protein ABIB71_03180 [Candidatus Woesearchaeota archaeon]